MRNIPSDVQSRKDVLLLIKDGVEVSVIWTNQLIHEGLIKAKVDISKITGRIYTTHELTEHGERFLAALEK